MHDSGNLVLDGDIIRYHIDGLEKWSLDVKAVRVFGESTDQMGPFADDYFFCFAVNAERWFEASFYARGRDQFLDDISTKLGEKIELGLCGSTDFASRVLWPPQIAGEAMFTYTDVPPKSLFNRLFAIQKNVQRFSRAVMALLLTKA